MRRIPSLPSRAVRAAAVLAVAAAAIPSAPVSAATSSACEGGAFTVTLPTGKVIRNTGTKAAASELSGGTIAVRGRYVDFDVVPSSLAVLNYTMTGAASPADITGGVRTPVFASKTPAITVSGEMSIVADDKGGLELRRGSGTKMKIQAKDCAQGGIFQMEPEAPSAVAITHTLAAGMFYFVNPFTGKVNLGNGTIFRGKDSPQVATRLSQTDTQTVWSVAPGGRLGGVLGEDAVELSAGATSCVQDCQAQNRIRGSLPVTDPAYSG